MQELIKPEDDGLDRGHLTVNLELREEPILGIPRGKNLILIRRPGILVIDQEANRIRFWEGREESDEGRTND